MNENFYKLFFRVIVGTLALYGAVNLTTQLRLAEHVRATVPRIESEIDAPIVETSPKKYR